MNITLIHKQSRQQMSKNIFFTISAMFLLASCGNLSNEVESEINKLKNKTESLDSLINKETQKVLTLDSLISKETNKIKELDTLINKSSQQIDSISRRGSTLLKKITH